jgi:hypothetical protein
MAAVLVTVSPAHTRVRTLQTHTNPSTSTFTSYLNRSHTPPPPPPPPQQQQQHQQPTLSGLFGFLAEGICDYKR